MKITYLILSSIMLLAFSGHLVASESMAAASGRRAKKSVFKLLKNSRLLDSNAAAAVFLVEGDEEQMVVRRRMLKEESSSSKKDESDGAEEKEASKSVAGDNVVKDEGDAACNFDEEECDKKYAQCKKELKKKSKKKINQVCYKKKLTCLRKLKKLAKKCHKDLKKLIKAHENMVEEKEEHERKEAEEEEEEEEENEKEDGKSGSEKEEEGSGLGGGLMAVEAREGLASDGSGQGPIKYWGGKVMAGPAVINLYLIYYGSWTLAQKGLIAGFVNGLSASSGPQGDGRTGTLKGWWRVSSAYSQRSPAATVSPTVRVAKEVTVGAGSKTTITEDYIWTLVQNQISRGAIPVDNNGQYMVLTAPNIRMSGFCNDYCGWHTWDVYGSTAVKYGFVGNAVSQCADGCIVGKSKTPNNDKGVDGVINVLAHEINEAATNPLIGDGTKAWEDDQGAEAADKCADDYGTYYDAGAYYYNLVGLNGRRYMVQSIWDASSQTCKLQR